VSLTRPSLRACPDCGQVQLVPALAVGASASCLRCDATLRRHRRDPIDPTLAFSLSALVLLTIAASATLLRVSNAGQNHTADLFSGPIGLEHDGMWELAVVVLIATVGAPFAKLGFTLYVLLALRLARPPRHIRTVFAWAMRLRPWSMIEVYLLGVFVACVKLGALVRIEVGVALYALAACCWRWSRPMRCSTARRCGRRWTLRRAARPDRRRRDHRRGAPRYCNRHRFRRGRFSRARFSRDRHDRGQHGRRSRDWRSRDRLPHLRPGQHRAGHRAYALPALRLGAARPHPR